MRNASAAQAVAAAVVPWETDFRRPRYEDWNFARLPATLIHLLSGHAGRDALPASAWGNVTEPFDTVILLVVDAFGLAQFQRQAERQPFLRALLESDSAIASPITSMFPSTTTAHMTTLHLGIGIGEHGAFEWRYYEPANNAIILPLAARLELPREELQRTKAGIGEDALYSRLFPFPTLYERLTALGIPSRLCQPEIFLYSPYNRTVTRGGLPTIGYREDDLQTAFEPLRSEALRTDSDRPRLLQAYFGQLDKYAHHYGPDSTPVDRWVDGFVPKLEAFLESLRGKCGRGLLLLTADHDQIETGSGEPLVLDRLVPELSESLQTGNHGPLWFGGSARDLFLYVRPERVAEMEERLRTVLAGRAHVRRTSDLMAEGLFGPIVGTRLAERVGTLAVLPLGNRVAVWGYPPFDLHHTGSHGGLSLREMESVLLAVPF